MPHEAATYQAGLTSTTPAETKAIVEGQVDDARDSYQSSFDATAAQYQGDVDYDGIPVLTSIDPDAYEAQPEDEYLLLTLTGDDFTGVTSVTLDGVAATTVSINDDHEIEATFPIPGDEGDLDVIAHKGARQSNAVALTFTIAP